MIYWLRFSVIEQKISICQWTVVRITIKVFSEYLSLFVEEKVVPGRKEGRKGIKE